MSRFGFGLETYRGSSLAVLPAGHHRRRRLLLLRTSALGRRQHTPTDRSRHQGLHPRRCSLLSSPSVLLFLLCSDYSAEVEQQHLLRVALIVDAEEGQHLIAGFQSRERQALAGDERIDVQGERVAVLPCMHVIEYGVVADQHAVAQGQVRSHRRERQRLGERVGFEQPHIVSLPPAR